MWERRRLVAKVLGAIAFGALAACSAQAQSNGASPAPAGVAPNTLRFVILYRPGPAWRADAPVERQNLRAHGHYMQSLLDSGRLFAAGALADEASGGLVIVNVATLAEARAIMDADPAVIDGVLIGEARPWRPRFFSDRPLVPSAD